MSCEQQHSRGIIDLMKSAVNGTNDSVAIRYERGHYLKGMARGPGRPAGSRNKLTEDFLGDMHAAWLERGREAIDRVIDERPEVFLAIVARTIDVRRVEVGRPGELQLVLSKEEILLKLEEQSGPEARKLFEECVARIEELEREQKAEWIGHRRKRR
jgi:hypothetical protein